MKRLLILTPAYFIILYSGMMLQSSYEFNEDFKIVLEDSYDLYDVYNTLEGTKSIHRDYLKEIRGIRFKEEILSKKTQRSLAGAITEWNLIYISDPYKSVFFHELGHSIYDKFLTEEQILEWEDIHKNSDIFVSNYAKTDAEEDFSESLAEYWNYEIFIRRTCIRFENCWDYIEKHTISEVREQMQCNYDYTNCIEGKIIYSEGLTKERIEWLLENIKPSEHTIFIVDI